MWSSPIFGAQNMRHEIIRSKSIAKRLWFIRRNINSLLQVKKYPRWPWKRQIEGPWRQVTWRKIFNFGPIKKWNMLFAICFSMCMVLHRSWFIICVGDYVGGLYLEKYFHIWIWPFWPKNSYNGTWKYCWMMLTCANYVTHLPTQIF